MIFFLALARGKRKPLVIHTDTTYSWPERSVRLDLHASRRWWAIDSPDPALAIKLATHHWSWLHSPAIQRPYSPPKPLRAARIITTAPGNAE